MLMSLLQWKSFLSYEWMFFSYLAEAIRLVKADILTCHSRNKIGVIILTISLLWLSVPMNHDSMIVSGMHKTWTPEQRQLNGF